MRELKFRCWGIKENKYLKLHSIHLSTSKFIVSYYGVGGGNISIALKDVIIEQYTGLKDKNGKEIYEGDIVEQFVCGVKKFKGKEVGRKTVWQVRWNEEECCFELHYLSGSLFGDSLMAKGEEYEVIGNIHENPDFLKGEE